MAKVNIEDLALCTDCTMAAVNNDFSSLSLLDPKEENKLIRAITSGLNELSCLGYLVPDSNREGDEFSTRQCDCCKTKLAGRREYFCTLM